MVKMLIVKALLRLNCYLPQLGSLIISHLTSPIGRENLYLVGLRRTSCQRLPPSLVLSLSVVGSQISGCEGGWEREVMDRENKDRDVSTLCADTHRPFTIAPRAPGSER